MAGARDVDAAVNTIGAVEVPDTGTSPASEYVPEATCTVFPALTLAAAAEIVQKGSISGRSWITVTGLAVTTTTGDAWSHKGGAWR